MKKVRVTKDCIARYRGIMTFKRGQIFLAYPVSSNNEVYSICNESDHFIGMFSKELFEDL